MAKNTAFWPHNKVLVSESDIIDGRVTLPLGILYISPIYTPIGPIYPPLRMALYFNR